MTDVIDVAVDNGVAERPPLAGRAYAAFCVHPPRPGPVALAIAHREGEMFVVDLVRERIDIVDAAPILRRYGITKITGAESEGDGRDLAHATMGVIALLQRRSLS